MNGVHLDFEKPVLDLEQELEQALITGPEERRRREARRIRKKLQRLRREVFGQLNPWQRTQLARHPGRPFFLDLAGVIFDEFTEVHGDRAFADDQAVVTLLARFEGRSVVAVGHQKGRNVKDNIRRNFGMPHPEGYRKALKVMRLAEKFGIPVLTFIDTPGAYPGLGAEERGQSEAIARNIFEMTRLKVPVVATVIGEGGSGGALAIGVADRVLMLEHSLYSVISPEACAAILWRDDRSKAPDAAAALRYGARDAVGFGLVDEAVREPPGGAHRDWERTGRILRRVLRRHLRELTALDARELVSLRIERYRAMGRWREEGEERR